MSMLMACVVSLLVVTSASSAKDTKAEQAQAIIEKAIQAHGGAKNLAKLKAVRTKIDGTAEIGGGLVWFTAELATRLPDRHRVTFTVAGETASSLRVISGDKAWHRADDRTEELKDEPLADVRASMHQTYVRSLLPLLKDSAFRLSPLGEVKVQDRPAVGVQVEVKGRTDINLYFDKTTGLLVKAERRGLGPH